jgi:outer membrane lipoprotein-sorting protein
MWAASTIVLLCSFASAQAQLPDDPREIARLCETVVQRWEKAMSDLESFEIAFLQTEEDKISQSTTVRRGTLKYLKSKVRGAPYRWSFNSQTDNKPKLAHEFKISDSQVFFINRADKEIMVANRKLPFTFIGQPDRAIEFALGTKEALRPFNVQLAGVSEDLFSLELRPKQPEKSAIQLMQITIDRKTSIPRTIQIREASSAEIKWEFTDVKTAVPLRPSDFEVDPAPKGWIIIRLPDFRITNVNR